MFARNHAVTESNSNDTLSNRKNTLSNKIQKTEPQDTVLDTIAKEGIESREPSGQETNSTKGPLSDEGKRNLQASKLLAARFGEIVGLLMRSPAYRHYSLSDLEWMIVPPLLNNQTLIAEARSEEAGLAMPIGIALWASVADDIDAKLSRQLDRPVRLHPSEWKSGDNLWLIDAVGSPQVVEGLISQLGTSVFQGKSFKVRHRDNDGKKSIRIINPKKADEKRADASPE